LSPQENDIPSILELKQEIRGEIELKVLGLNLPETVTDCPIQTYVITPMHKVSFMMLPSAEVMEFKNTWIGSKADTLMLIKDFFGSRDFKNLLKKCKIVEEINYQSEEMRMMGFGSEIEPPTRRLRADPDTQLPVINSQQQKWAQKWLDYSNFVRDQPAELSADSQVMTQKQYSTTAIKYLDNYRKIDGDFAKVAIELILMLPSSSSSEHLWSLSNKQVKPNIEFQAVANRSLLASNAGLLMNGYC